MKNSTNIKIPKKYIPMINEIYQDNDGYWVDIKDGFWSPEMQGQTIHEDTQIEALRLIRNIEIHE